LLFFWLATFLVITFWMFLNCLSDFWALTFNDKLAELLIFLRHKFFAFPFDFSFGAKLNRGPVNWAQKIGREKLGARNWARIQI
jgi:hypothetical protein